MADLILFDLDGTLTMPEKGIINAFIYMLKKLDRPVPDWDYMRRFIGPPLRDSFSNELGMDEETVTLAVSIYREYYSARGLFENEVIPGVPELLKRLKDGGRRLAVATSKPQGFSEQILEHFGLKQYLDFVGGAGMDESRATKREVIEWTLENLGFPPRDNAVMVGDREHDVLGALQCGIPCVGVLYGYGSRDELLRAGAVSLAVTPEQLGDILL